MTNRLTLEEFIGQLPQPSRDGCLRFYNDYKDRIITAAGSFIKDQSWKGGYVGHIEETMNIAKVAYEGLLSIRPLPFSLADAYLSLFWHDAEKIFKYTEPNKTFHSENENFTLILELMREYGITISDDVKNAIIYVHGEGEMYSSFENVQRPLAAFIHCCDTISARIWSDFPKNTLTSNN